MEHPNPHPACQIQFPLALWCDSSVGIRRCRRGWCCCRTAFSRGSRGCVSRCGRQSALCILSLKRFPKLFVCFKILIRGWSLRSRRWSLVGQVLRNLHLFQPQIKLQQILGWFLPESMISGILPKVPDELIEV